MKLDLILSGVGGQGILTIAYLIDNAAIHNNYDLKQAEVHGMSQRGGEVYSHLRVNSKKVLSDLIPKGKADAIISMEPLEVGRYIEYLHKDGMMFSNSAPFKNIDNYPEEKQVLDFLFSNDKAVVIDAKAVAMAASNPRGANVALLGAATPYLPFSLEDFEKGIEELFAAKGEKVINMNKEVLKIGCKVGEMYKQLRELGVSNQKTSEFIQSLDMKNLDSVNVIEESKKLK